MMAAVSVPHDPYHAPTTRMPVVPPPRGDSPRLKILGAVTAGTALVVALAVWAISPGDDDDPAATPVAAPSAVAAAPPAEEAGSAAPAAEGAGSAGPPAGEAQPSATPGRPAATAPSATPKPVRTTTRRQRPAELLAQLGVVVDALAERDELDDDDARSLKRRLRDAGRRLERGDREKAVEKLEDFTEKAEDLREDDDLSEDGFSALTAGAAQIAALLSRS